MKQSEVYPSEHDEQVALFEWASLSSRFIPELELMFAIPNGGHRHISVAKRLKKEGVKSGIPDIFLPCYRGTYIGLWIEMKSKNGMVSENQKTWISRLTQEGYKVKVCYGFDDAKEAILEYLSL